jgi:hypothetical protein
MSIRALSKDPSSPTKISPELVALLKKVRGVRAVGVSEWYGKTLIVVYANTTELRRDELPIQYQGLPVVVQHSGS